MTTKANSRPAAEIATMGAISQQGAAWALGLSPRSLRDHPEIRRHPDGTYDVRSLVQFARGAGKLPSLTDEQFEAVLQIGSRVSTDMVADIMRAVKTLAAEIGGDELAALGAIALVLWLDKTEQCLMYPDQLPVGPKRFNRVHVCEGRNCGKVRRGRRWLQIEPPEDQPTIGALCPDCQKSFGRVRTPADDIDADLDECEMDPVPVRRGRK